jgi:cellulose synthase/poly-beta-1,6-N-acetylglucosamine synthase-like glycosyltransferase
MRERAIVCVPVRDEEAGLPRLIMALQQQVSICPRSVSFCFLLDGCRDRSAAILQTAAGVLEGRVHLEFSPPAPPSAGRARRAACQAGLSQAPAARFLLTTDADTIPAPDWIVRTIDGLERADVVAGHIVRENPQSCPLRFRQEAYLARLHRLRRHLDPVPYDPLPSHPSLGGASLGFRRETYDALGGFPPLASGEDRALVAAARRQGWRVRHDAAVRVVTSGRTAGRAPEGLASELAALPESPQQLAVPDPRAAAAFYRMQAWLRRAFDAGLPPSLPPPGLASLARTRPLAALRRAAPGADAFVQMASPPEAGLPGLPLDEAEACLQEIETRLNPAEAA